MIVGTRLASEYPDPSGGKRRAINRYIQGDAGTTFMVMVDCGYQVFQMQEGMICTLTIDGVAVDHVLFRPGKGQSCAVFDVFRGVAFEHVRWEYVFADLADGGYLVLELEAS